MNQYDAQELAYKNGYAAGLKAAEKEKTKLAHKNRKLVHTNAKLARLERAARQENAELRDQVYNLTLYLRESMEATHGTVGFAVRNVLDERHPGVPGYNPEILEALHE